MFTYRNQTNSRSPRAQAAEDAGRKPWSRLTAAERHGLTKAQALDLQLHLGEWHHSSEFANRVEYFDPAIIERVLSGIGRADIKAAAIAVHSHTAWEAASDEAQATVKLIESRRDTEWEQAEWTK